MARGRKPHSATTVGAITLSPDPLPHGATGTVAWAGQQPASVRVGLLRDNGDLTAVSFHSLETGSAEFNLNGPTPTWDGTGGGTIQVVVYDPTDGGNADTALIETMTGTYLA